MNGAGTPPVPLRTVYAAVFAVMTGYGMTLTVLPFAAARVHGLGAIDTGGFRLHVALLTSVYPFTQLLVSPAVGRWADRSGYRPVLLTGLGGLAAAQVAFGFADDLSALYAIRAVAGLAAGAMLVAATAAIAIETSDEERGRAMGLFGAAVSLGLVGGPAIGALLGGLGVDDRLGPLTLDQRSLPFAVTGLAIAVIALVASRSLPPGARAAPDARPGVGKTALRSLLGLVGVSQFGLALFEGTIVLYTRERLQIDADGAAALFVVCGLVMAAVQPAAGIAMRDHRREVVGVSGGLAMMALGIASVTLVESLGAAVGAVTLLATGTALVTPGLSSWITRMSGHRTGSALGWRNTAGGVGQLTGPLVGIPLLAWSSTAPFLLSSMLLLAAVSLVVRAPSSVPLDE